MSVFGQKTELRPLDISYDHFFRHVFDDPDDAAGRANFFFEPWLFEAYKREGVAFELNDDITNGRKKFYMIHYNDEVAGWVSLTVRECQSWYLATFVVRKYRRGGVGSDARSALCYHALTHWNVDRVFSRVQKTNTGSIASIKKAGFQLCGAIPTMDQYVLMAHQVLFLGKNSDQRPSYLISGSFDTADFACDLPNISSGRWKPLAYGHLSATAVLSQFANHLHSTAVPAAERLALIEKFVGPHASEADVAEFCTVQADANQVTSADPTTAPTAEQENRAMRLLQVVPRPLRVQTGTAAPPHHYAEPLIPVHTRASTQHHDLSPDTWMESFVSSELQRNRACSLFVRGYEVMRLNLFCERPHFLYNGSVTPRYIVVAPEIREREKAGGHPTASSADDLHLIELGVHELQHNWSWATSWHHRRCVRRSPKPSTATLNAALDWLKSQLNK